MRDLMEQKAISAINFIESNLKNPIGRDDVADRACLSLRQFNRTFYRCTGDSLGSYLKIRRLTQASKELVSSSETILSIALKYQFNSAEVFSRAFRRAFWMPPSRFRQIGCAYTAKQRNPFLAKQLGVIQKSNFDHPDIVFLPTNHFVGFISIQPHYGFQVEDNTEEGKSLTDRLWDYFPAIKGVMDHRLWNIAFIRKTMNHFHEIENFFAVGAKGGVNPPDDLTYLCLPHCQYARFIHSGSDNDMGLALSLAFQWLEKSPYFLGDGPSLCRIDPNQKHPTEIYLPINTQFIANLTWWQGYSQPYLWAVAGQP